MSRFVPVSRRWRVLAGGSVVGLLLLGLGGAWLVTRINPLGPVGEEVTVLVSDGASASAIAGLLEDEGVITSARIFRLYMRVKGAGTFLAGEYRLRKRMDMGDVVATLEAGPVIRYARLTIPEGLTLEQVAQRVEGLEGRTAARFLDVVRSGAVRSRYEPGTVVNLEGLLFPDTYQVSEEEDEEALLRRMVALFEQVADEVGVAPGAAEVGLTPYEVVIVASLIEREAKVPEERPLISAVIHNRLREGMLLQIDATVLYALGEHRERVLFRDLEIDSPYNTYRHPGLPPTPIAAPGRESLLAALEPADTGYLYYVKIDESGKHAFATTPEEHQRNVAEARRLGVR